MAEQDAKSIFLTDPLSEVTRKERRMLLGISMLGIAIVKTGLVPTKISALGVELEKTNQQALLGILALVTLYFVVAFLIYAATDYLAWLQAIRAYRNKVIQEGERLERKLFEQRLREENLLLNSRMDFGSKTIFILSGAMSTLRAAFEFLLPIVVGIYAVQLLFFAVGRI